MKEPGTSGKTVSGLDPIGNTVHVQQEFTTQFCCVCDEIVHNSDDGEIIGFAFRWHVSLLFSFFYLIVSFSITSMRIYPVCHSSRMSEHGVIGVLCSDQQGLALSGSWSLCQLYNSLINYTTPSSLLAILSFSIQHQDNVFLYYLKVIINKSLVNHMTFILLSFLS